MARKYQSRAATAFIQCRIVGHRQIPNITVLGEQISLTSNRQQPVGQQQGVELIDVGAQRFAVVTADVEGDIQRIELVILRHLALD